MKAKMRHLGTALVVAAAAAAALVPVAQGGPGTPGIDANSRMHADKLLGVAAMQDAHQRVGIVSEPSRLPVGVDANERSLPLTRTITPTRSVVSDDGFDWSDAAVGASSAFALALLVGISLMTARHYRSRPLLR